MYILMIFIFVIGYFMIALEHPLKIDKAAPALLIAVLGWTAYVIGADVILEGYKPFLEYLSSHPTGTANSFIVEELSHSLSHHAEIIFFLMGAMVIVELIDAHEGFSVITEKITSTNKVKLMWILSFLTFFLSATVYGYAPSVVFRPDPEHFRL